SEWLTKVVNETSHNLESNQMFEIEATVHYLEVSVHDERNESVSDVHLTFIYDDTERVANADLTNVNGNVTIRLPETDCFAYDIVTRWRGVDVGTTESEELPENRTVNIQLEIYYIEVRAVDSTQDNADLNNASLRVYNQETGALANSAVLNSTGRAEVRLPSGEHSFQVYWKGVQVSDENINVVDDTGEQLIVCDVYNLEVEVRDDVNQLVENARVEIRHAGRLLGELRTAQNGITPTARFPEAQLTIKVSWRGVPVNETTYYLDQNSVDDNSYLINASIYQVHFTIEDHHGEELGDASISLFNQSSLIASGGADGSGILTMRLPGGNHLTTIEWKNVMVYEAEQTIEASTSMTITVTDVYHVDFRGLDSEGVEVDRASVITMIGGEQVDSGMTEDGVFNTRVPTPQGEAGDVTVRVIWRDVEVYNDIETVSGDRVTDPIDLDLAIYYLDYELVDAQGNAVENARIFVRHSEISEGRNLIADRMTDENGTIQFRLPRGEQTFTARWKEITVAEEENFSLNSNELLNKTADIYYLDMEVFDDRGEPLVGSEVRITYQGADKLYQSQHTDENGKAMARIPAAEWDVEVKWIDTQIYSDSFTVSEDQTELEMQTRVHYLTIETTNKSGEKLSDVHVKVISEDRVWSGYTENGSITFRLPELPEGENYTIEGNFKTTYLLTDVNVNETDTIELGSTEEPEKTMSFDDYPIPLYRTNLFIFIGILIVILAAIAYAYRKESGTEIEEEEPETEEEEMFGKEESEEESFEEEEKETQDKSEAIDEFVKVKGIGPTNAKRLYEGGFESIEQLKDASIEDITDVKGIGKSTAEMIFEDLDEENQ
ncbi:MAG: helix-hairpin-helix domain-containing protein, partial [Candidatus Thermoplasmatota archaeon]|nr:helix-hairpin-helix domain-containing protein [Candidatus Thermoplasmatota archaeon]